MRRFVLVGLVVLLASSGWSALAIPTPPPTPVPPYGSPSPFPTVLHTPPPTARPPEVSAASAVLLDLDSGEVLYERAARRRRPIASTTKIMTALLVLESATPFDEVIASDQAASQEGAELGLEPGERIRVQELLYALMLQSANDAAVSLAEHVGGSVEAFVEQMNERARTLGLADTRFASPNGLDDSGYSTAQDLAAITVAAFGSSTFGETVGARFRTIPAPEGQARRIQNRNALLWLYPDSIGVKTGYTAAAGYCLVAAAEREGLRLATVVLGSPNEPFSDAATLLNYGFEAYERRTVATAGGVPPPEVNLNVSGQDIPLTAAESLTVLVRREHDINLDFRLADFPFPPIKKGEYVGELVVKSRGEELGSVDIVTREVVPAPPPQLVDPRPWWERAWESITSFLADAFGPVLEGRSL